MTDEMIMTLIVCDTGVSEHVLQLLDEAKVPGYTVTQDASGMSENGRRENSAVWPGVNTTIHCACTAEQLAQVKESIRLLRESRSPRHVPLRLFSWKLTEMY
ncbi:MAG: PG0541 family transporter-associated protein [Armatimonadota bacterium]